MLLLISPVSFYWCHETEEGRQSCRPWEEYGDAAFNAGIPPLRGCRMPIPRGVSKSSHDLGLHPGI